jgi:hypothetical protein
MPLITVVTAAKNAAAFMPECLSSIQRQTLTDWEHVVVDDGSDDGTGDLVERAAQDDARIRVLRVPASIGAYAAANLAMLEADSRYLARLDADDVALPDRLQAQVDVLDAQPTRLACAGAWQYFNEHGPDGPVRPVPSHRNGVIKWMMWFRSNLLHSTLLMETQRFRDLGGYGPARIGEDFRLWAALARAGEIAVTDAPLTLYRSTPGQMTAATGARDQPERVQITLEHIQACAPGTWTLDDARDFRWIGEDGGFPAERALGLLDRFEGAWRADGSLDAADRRELAALTAARRIRHLRNSLGRRPAQVTLAAMRHAPTLLRSSALALAGRAYRWP